MSVSLKKVSKRAAVVPNDPLTQTERALWTIISVLDHHGWPWRNVYAMKDHIDLIDRIEKRWNENRLKLSENTVAQMPANREARDGKSRSG